MHQNDTPVFTPENGFTQVSAKGLLLRQRASPDQAPKTSSRQTKDYELNNPLILQTAPTLTSETKMYALMVETDLTS